MKQIIIAIALLLSCNISHAQYTMTGKIEFERKVNVYAQIEEMEDHSWYDRIKSQIPKFSITYFDMIFDTAKSLYKPGREPETKNPMAQMMGGGPGMDNIVYTDLLAQKVTANKQVYEQKFLVQDSMRKIDWKEKDELRTIGNYKCRKAVGRICDSVYVVAFYAEDIPVASGPEMFGGLPGMILELAIPRLHTTWVATKVDVEIPKATDFVIPEKGKKVNEKGLYEAVQPSFKSWGNMAARNIWWTVL